VSWNVRFQELESRIGEVVESLVDSKADIVCLQEVTTGLVESAAELLADYGFTSSVDGMSAAKPGPWGRKPFASMVASKFPARRGPNDWRLNSPFPESFARAIVETPDGPIDVTSVHVPNGAANGWKKVATLKVLSAALSERSDIPRIVSGDFNEPKDLLADGQIVTFSEIEPGEQKTGHRLWTDHDGQTGDLHEWEDAVQALLGPNPTHDLIDAHLAVNGGMFMPTTHLVSGRYPRWYDHVLIDRKLTVHRTGVFASWMEAGYSDHSGVWADFA